MLGEGRGAGKWKNSQNRRKLALMVADNTNDATMGTSTQIRITAGHVSLAATLNDSETARRIIRALPIEARANRWGDEIYFTIAVAAGEENPQEVVAVGDLAYWPPGRAFCIFFGPTPASAGGEPRAASPVNVVGRVTGDAAQFRQVRDGEPVKIELA